MKNCILFVVLWLMASELYAFRVRGSIEGVSSGEWVYLCTDAPDGCNHKWQLSCVADSVKVGCDGCFELETRNVSHGRLWLLRSEKKLIQYFFSSGEDYEVRGKAGNIGLRTKSVVCGRDALLAEEVMSLMETAYITPVERRIGIGWLKRFAAEDAGVWALAYYYSVLHNLEWREVEEILPLIPEKQYGNPYYEVIRRYHDRQKLVQDGMILTWSAGSEKNDESVDEDFLRGHPFLVYAFPYEGPAFEKTYLRRACDLADLTRRFPDMRLILACPEFTDSVCKHTLNDLSGEQIRIMSLKSLCAGNAWAGALKHSEGIVLADKNGRVMTTTGKIGKLESVLAKGTEWVPHYIINGYVVGVGSGVAELVYAGNDGMDYGVRDTASIVNGHFRFEGTMDRPEYCNIGIRGTDYPVGFWLDNEVTDVHIRVVDAGTSSGERPFLDGKIYGNRLEEKYRKLADSRDETEIQAQIGGGASDPVVLFWMAYVLIKDYPLKTVEKWFRKLDKGLKKYREYQDVEQYFRLQNALQPGNEAPVFHLVGQEGERVALTSFRGKYVLLDFWASCCGPCRAEIPHLKELWSAWHEKGLEILSISLDRKRSGWEGALEEERMPWKQVWDRDGKVGESYNVQSIPHLVLVGPDGHISAVNLRGKMLEDKLQEILN